MWFEIIKSLADHIAATLDDTAVNRYASASVPRRRQVDFLRGPGTPTATFRTSGKFEQTVYVECWEFDEDADTASAALESLENEVIAALLSCGAVAAQSQTIEAIVKLTNIEPDGDAFRPSVGSRMTLVVTGRAKRNER